MPTNFGSGHGHHGKTVTIEGVVYQLTLVADSDGNVVTPATLESLHGVCTVISEQLLDVKHLLESIAEQ